MTGAQILVVKRDCEINVREIPQRRLSGGNIPALRNASVVKEKGETSRVPMLLNQYLDDLEEKSVRQNKTAGGLTSTGPKQHNLWTKAIGW